MYREDVSRKCLKMDWSLFILPLTVILSFSLVCCLPKTTASENIDQSTPEAVIALWYEAANTQDMRLQKALVDVDSDMMKTALRGSERLAKAGIAYQISDVEVYEIENNGHEAKFRVKYDFKVVSKRGESEVQVGGDFLRLTRKGERWYIVSLGDDL